MVLHRDAKRTEHRRFSDILEYFVPGDALVINTTRVMPARLFGRRPDTGGRAEVLLTRPLDGDTWEALARPAKRLKAGAALDFGAGLTATVVRELGAGLRVLRFASGSAGVWDAIESLGRLPLPPYIKEKPRDEGRYQTVYARQTGSAAAPTAGLHFTPELLNAARAKGVKVVPVLLHVGLGTFRPVQTERVEDHRMHEEYYEVPQKTAEAVNETRANGGRVIAVGTTTGRSRSVPGAIRVPNGWDRSRFRHSSSLVAASWGRISTRRLLRCQSLGRGRYRRGRRAGRRRLGPHGGVVRRGSR